MTSVLRRLRAAIGELGTEVESEQLAMPQQIVSTNENLQARLSSSGN